MQATASTLSATPSRLHVTSLGQLHNCRRGSAYVLSFVFMGLFSALAVGFYSQVNLSAQVAANEKRAMDAQLAAESGLQFVRLQLSSISIPPNVRPEHRFKHLHAKLCVALNGTPNFRGSPIGGVSSDILIPGGDSYIELERGGRMFRAVVTETPEGNLRVKVIGTHAGSRHITRAVQVDFAPTEDHSVFRHGMAAGGTVKLSGDVELTGATETLDTAVLSASGEAYPVEIGHNANVGGEIRFVNPAGKVKTTGRASVRGKFDQRVYATDVVTGVRAPEFPFVDVTAYKPFATNVLSATSVAGAAPSYHANVLVPANTNPTFGGDVVLEGVVYVQMPNKLTFEKGVTLRGVIVYEPAPGYVKGTDNAIVFKQGATLLGMDQVTNSRAFPDELRALGGASIIAPQTEVRLSGHSGAIAQTLVTDDLRVSGHVGAVVKGNVIALGDVRFERQASLRVEVPETTVVANALRFSTTYTAVPATYLEVRP